MKRREFITLAGGAAAWPMVARGQAKTPVIGFLNTGAPDAFEYAVAAFRKGLSEMGFTEGRNVGIEFRWGLNDFERHREMAAELVSRNVAVIAAVGSVQSAVAARALTSTIPIVFSSSGDPVRLGLVVSDNKPGGNVTGFNDMSSEILPKHLALLHDLLPHALHLGALMRRANPWADVQIEDARSAAQTAGVAVETFFAGREDEIDSAFADIARERLAALALATDGFFLSRIPQIIALAAHDRLPVIYSNRNYVDAGGLMSYGPFAREQGRQAGLYTGRILKGDKPADLPILQPTRFEFVINLKTAKTMALDVPPNLLALADEVIE